jgi:hypothetical protein
MPITLNAVLKSISGAAAGNNAKMKITLCGYGSQQPRVAGSGVLVDVSTTTYFTGGTLTTTVYGNDAITPAGTFYCIQTIDEKNRCISANNYRFAGSATVDLSNAAPDVWGAASLLGVVPNGKMPGQFYSVPEPTVRGSVATALFYNGQLQDSDNFTLSGAALSLGWITSKGDRLYLLYPVRSGRGTIGYSQLQPFTAIANGQFPGRAYTVPTAPAGAQFVAAFINGGFMLPANYTLSGQNLQLNFTTQPTDEIQVLFMIGAPLTTIGFFGAWSNAVTYSINQVVSEGGSSYVSLQNNNLNQDPATTPAFWQLIGAGGDVFPGTSYTMPAAPANGVLVALFSAQRGFLRPGIDYALAGATITTNYLTDPGDSLYAIHL